jgi:hypothetical protein
MNDCVTVLICALLTALTMTFINLKASDRALRVLTGYSIYLSSAIAIVYLVVIVLKFGH